MPLETRSRQAAALALTIASLVIVSAPVGVDAQDSPARKHTDLSGSYERYRGVPGARGGGRDPLVPPPPSQPPLKAQYLKDWQAKQQAAREADARGEPLAASVVQCLPQASCRGGTEEDVKSGRCHS